jgi:hypothetical protein
VRRSSTGAEMRADLIARLRRTIRGEAIAEMGVTGVSGRIALHLKPPQVRRLRPLRPENGDAVKAANTGVPSPVTAPIAADSDASKSGRRWHQWRAGLLSRRRIGVCLIQGGARGRFAPQPMARLSGPHRSQAIGLHRRDLDEDQHDPLARLGAEGRAPRRQGSSWPLEDRDFPRRAAQRPHRSALPVRRSYQRRTLPRLCRTVPRSDA